MKAITGYVVRYLTAVVLAVVAGHLMGCAGRVEKTPPFTEATLSQDYAIDRVGGFTGYAGLLAAHCDASHDVIMNANCSVEGGELTTQTAAYGGWECGAQWYDTAKGGTISLHLDCERGK